MNARIDASIPRDRVEQIQKIKNWVEETEGNQRWSEFILNALEEEYGRQITKSALDEVFQKKDDLDLIDLKEYNRGKNPTVSKSAELKEEQVKDEPPIPELEEKVSPKYVEVMTRLVHIEKTEDGDRRTKAIQLMYKVATGELDPTDPAITKFIQSREGEVEFQ